MDFTRQFSRALPLALAGALLCSGCVPLTTAREPSEASLILRDGRPRIEDCARMQDPSPLKQGINGQTPRPSFAFGCATYNNLARMVANPNDLIAPRPYAGQNPVAAGAAVERLETDKVKPLLSTTTTSGSSGSSSSSGGS